MYNQQKNQTSNQPIEYMETDDGFPSLTYKPPVVQYNHVPSLTYNHTPVQNNQLQTVSSMSPGYNIRQNQPTNKPTRSKYNRPIGIEHKLYLCTLCETPTKFADYHKLGKHVERFHSAFNQDNKGVKRGIVNARRYGQKE